MMLDLINKYPYKYCFYGITFQEKEIDGIKAYFSFDEKNYKTIFSSILGYEPSMVVHEKPVLDCFPCIGLKLRKDGKTYTSFYHAIDDVTNQVRGIDVFDNHILEREYEYIWNPSTSLLERFHISTIPCNTCTEICNGITIRNGEEVPYHKISFIPALPHTLLNLSYAEEKTYHRVLDRYTIVANCVDSQGFKAVYYLDTSRSFDLESFISEWFPT